MICYLTLNVTPEEEMVCCGTPPHPTQKLTRYPFSLQPQIIPHGILALLPCGPWPFYEVGRKIVDQKMGCLQDSQGLGWGAARAGR